MYNISFDKERRLPQYLDTGSTQYIIYTEMTVNFEPKSTINTTVALVESSPPVLVGFVLLDL